MTAQGVRTVGPRGVRFRSRLEARWAALFTLLRWPWQYEPDLGLDGWIPDFAISAAEGLLIEVKPAIVLSDFERHKERIERSGTVKPVWLVGAEPVVGLWYAPELIGCWGPIAVHDVARILTLNATHVGPDGVQRLWVRAGNALQWRRM